MSQDFASMKAGRTAYTEKLISEIQKTQKSGGTDYNDPRYWQPVKDKTGSGFALIRFLPAPKDEDVPFVKLYEYSYHNKDNDQYYIEKCRSTLGEPDPMNELNLRLYRSKKEENIAEAKKHPRKTKYISNVLVLKHPARPEDEGKVFLYGYGKKIMEKINSLLEPSEEEIALGMQPRNPFDFWTGANFRLKVRKVDNFPNYDKSEFDMDSALSNDDDELARIWAMQYPLLPEIAPDKFKSREELVARLDKVLGVETSNSNETAAKPVSYDAEVNNDVEETPPWEGHAEETPNGESEIEFLTRITQTG